MMVISSSVMNVFLLGHLKPKNTYTITQQAIPYESLKAGVRTWFLSTENGSKKYFTDKNIMKLLKNLGIVE
jgi:hypothetical protein